MPMNYLRKQIGCFLAGLAVWGCAQPALADSLSFGGLITLSPDDGNLAVNNPSLNNIMDGDAYSVTLLNFPESITGPGLYGLTLRSMAFSDPTAPASETSFGTSLCGSLACLTVSTDAMDGAFDDIGLFACLTTGSGCLFGDYLSVNFEIPAASLNSTNVAASLNPGLNPSFDLLEDDGVTDVQGSVTSYSYTGTSPAPEPSFLVPLLLLLPPFVWISARRSRRPPTS
jgi:hypothetical protein